MSSSLWSALATPEEKKYPRYASTSAHGWRDPGGCSVTGTRASWLRGGMGGCGQGRPASVNRMTGPRVPRYRPLAPAAEDVGATALWATSEVPKCQAGVASQGCSYTLAWVLELMGRSFRSPHPVICPLRDQARCRIFLESFLFLLPPQVPWAMPGHTPPAQACDLPPSLPPPRRLLALRHACPCDGATCVCEGQRRAEQEAAVKRKLPSV